MEKEILDYIKYGGWILFGSGMLFEISPIKFNPISMLLGWIGNRLNRDVKKDISQIQSDVKTLQYDLQDHKVESMRRNILNFADELMRGEEKSKENYVNIISLHDRYNNYVETKGLTNGQIDLAFKYISNKYQYCLEHNSFYDGK
ncbi:MAG: hypothetical protein K0S18_10 [Anaerocolumna sp.]|jgi:hypothetical protein|nr:hypothetical protein [Anaerocolumna sp.]